MRRGGIRLDGLGLMAKSGKNKRKNKRNREDTGKDVIRRGHWIYLFFF